MATTFKYLTGAYTTLMSAELNSLANNGSALGSAFDNSMAGSGAFWGLFELVYQSGPSNPNSGSSLTLFLIPAPNGTNYADTGTNVPPGLIAGAFTVQSGTAQRVEILGITLPPTLFKPMLVNQAGVTLSASASQLNFLPYTPQGT